MNSTFNHGLYIETIIEKEIQAFVPAWKFVQNMDFIMQSRKKKAQTMEQSP